MCSADGWNLKSGKYAAQRNRKDGNSMVKKITVAVLVVLFFFPIIVFFQSEQEDISSQDRKKAEEYFAGYEGSVKPCTKEDGGKYTIAYVDIDPYPASGEMLYYFVEQLREEGWIEYDGELPFDASQTDAKELINYLAGLDLGRYVQFSREANYYIGVEGKRECMERLKKQIEEGLVDLIFCMGTSPGEMVIREMGITEVPVMVYFSVDPVGAGLSDNEEYSGKENVWCHTSSEVYANQMQFYCDNCPFKNIGMVYYNESVAAMNSYREAAEKIGFQITERKVKTLSEQTDVRQVKLYYKMLEETFRELAESGEIDAFMLNTDMIKDENRIRELLEIFYQKNIPVFVQNGEYYVEYGAFMVVTASDAKVQAPFAVDAFAKILNGRKPGDVYQKFVTPPYLSINLEVAERLGYQVRQELLLSAEKLYSSVRNTKEDETDRGDEGA